MIDLKKWYTSKTIWANVLTLVGTVVLTVTGVAIPVEIVTMTLGAINVGLRIVTKEEISW